MKIRAKKRLGQHFLKDRNIAQKVADSLNYDKADVILEIGPGMGVLTEFLLKNAKTDVYVIEIDSECVDYLRSNFLELQNKIIEHDFLTFDIAAKFSGRVAIVGNFPYNISSQILFHALKHRNMVHEVAGMFQREVALRIASKEGSKTYGILSVLLQAYYNTEYLFTVDEHVFHPPPKVKSAVVRLERNNVDKLNCNEQLFFRIVKTTFNQRRKMLRNSLKPILGDLQIDNIFMQKRPEQLSIEDFIDLTNAVDEKFNKQ